MFIKKIFQNNIDESVNKQFVRFGKGKFEKRALINVIKGSRIKVSTSFEFANDLVYFIGTLAQQFRIRGTIFNKQEVPNLKGKKKNRLFVYDIEKEASGEELKNLAINTYYILLDCTSQDNSINLKIKKKLPKPEKSSKKTVDDKFCSLILDIRWWPKVHDEFLFDLPFEIKKTYIEHIYIINDVIISKEMEKEKDFEKIRLKAKRKGKIIRKIIVDKKELVKEKEFII